MILIIQFINDISELPLHMQDEIRHFSLYIKHLKEKKTIVKEVYGRNDAKEAIKRAIKLYEDTFEKNKKK